METTETVLKATGHRSVRSLAAHMNMPPATLNRQLRENTVPLGTLIAICREFDLDLVDLLVSMGQLTRREGSALHASRGLDSYTDLELAGELYRRTATAAAGDRH